MSVNETDRMKIIEDDLLNAINSLINDDKTTSNKVNNKSTPKYFIRCTKTEVSNVYFLIDSDKSSEEIYSLIDGCNSEEDMLDILHENGICCIDREEESSEYENEFNVDEVEECR